MHNIPKIFSFRKQNVFFALEGNLSIKLKKIAEIIENDEQNSSFERYEVKKPLDIFRNDYIKTTKGKYDSENLSSFNEKKGISLRKLFQNLKFLV